MKQQYLVCVPCFLVLATTALAEDRFPSTRGEEFEWGLGLGALVEDEGYAGMDAEMNGQPLLYVNSRRFRFLANQMDYQVIRNERWLLGVKAEARFDGFESDDAEIFTGMEEREGGIYGGLRLEYRSLLGNFVGEYASEISGDANGSYGSVGTYWTLKTGLGEFVPKLAIEHYDSAYVDYYYGVPLSESTTARPPYHGDSTLNLDAGFDYIVRFGDRHQLLSSVKYRRYGSEIKESPLVDANGSLRFVLGYCYAF